MVKKPVASKDVPEFENEMMLSVGYLLNKYYDLGLFDPDEENFREISRPAFENGISRANSLSVKIAYIGVYEGTDMVNLIIKKSQSIITIVNIIMPAIDYCLATMIATMTPYSRHFCF